MDRYDFVFSLAGFDLHGEEHRYQCFPTAIDSNHGLRLAARGLADFAARLLRCDSKHMAVKRILLKSAWRNGARKTRVNARELFKAMLEDGMAARGREGHRISSVPRKPFRPSGRR